MIIYVLDKELTTIGLIDDYNTLVWSERYSESGDFELELPISYHGSELVLYGNFLEIRESTKIMIIEYIKPDVREDRSVLLVKGQSAESILKRRVLIQPYTMHGLLEQLAYVVVEDSITNPGDSVRHIDIFSDDFPTVSLSNWYTNQFIPGETNAITIYDVIKTMCDSSGCGFRVVRVGDLLQFQIYRGENRAYEQDINSYVIFADQYNNIVNSNYFLSEKDKITLVVVWTNDLVWGKVFVTGVEHQQQPEGLDRYEAFLETTIEREVEGYPPLNDADTLAAIITRGREVIEEHKPAGLFGGDFVIDGTFTYDRDFFMGDLVQCHIAEMNVRSRVVELVRSYSVEGLKTYLTMDFNAKI